MERVLPTLARQLTSQARQEEVIELPKAQISGHRIHYRLYSGCAVVRPEGACNTDTTEALAKLVNSSLLESRNLIVDLSHSRYVETPGYRWIVRQFEQLELSGKSLIVTGLPPSVERAFKLLGLDRMVPVARDVSIAMEMIQAPKEKIAV